MCLDMCLVALAAICLLTQLPESTCSLPSFQVLDDQVYIIGCSGELLYEQNKGCKEVNFTSENDEDFLIGKAKPEIEGWYCCDNECSICTNVSVDNFIDIAVNLTNINTSVSASRSFTLEPVLYIGSISRQNLELAVQFKAIASASNDTPDETYECHLNKEDASCNGDNYSINKKSYSLTIFKINLDNPAHCYETSFTKYSQSNAKYYENDGPTFCIRVEPAVSLSFDNVSNTATCNVETTLPATLRLFVGDSIFRSELSINSTNCSKSWLLDDLPPGKHQLVCEVTSVMLTSNDSKIVMLTNATTNTPGPPSSAIMTPLPTTPISTSSPSPTPALLGINKLIISATVVSIALVVGVVITVIAIVLFRRRHLSPREYCSGLQASPVN